MSQTLSEMINDLPKPVTREEQFLYSLICSTAGVTPRYAITQNPGFKRMEQFWRVFWLSLSAKVTDLETPGENSVNTAALQSGAVTFDKLDAAVKSRLWSESRNGEVNVSNLNNAVKQRLWGTDRTGEVILNYLAAALQSRLWGANRNGEVTEDMLSAEVRSKLNGGATYYLVTIPTLTHQTFTVSVNGVARGNTQSFYAEEDSEITFTDPVADTGYTAGTLTVTGGTAVTGETNTYTLTSNMTFSITEATGGGGGGGDEPDPGGDPDPTPTPSESFDITALDTGETLLQADTIATFSNAAESDWQTKVDCSDLNTAIGQGNTVNIEYAVFCPTGNAFSWGPEFVIYTNGSTNTRFSATANTMHSTSYTNGTLYTAVVQYTINTVEENLMPFYKQHGANSGNGEIKVRLRASNLTQAMTPDVVSNNLYP